MLCTVPIIFVLLSTLTLNTNGSMYQGINIHFIALLPKSFRDMTFPCFVNAKQLSCILANAEPTMDFTEQPHWTSISS